MWNLIFCYLIKDPERTLEPDYKQLSEIAILLYNCWNQRARTQRAKCFLKINTTSGFWQAGNLSSIFQIPGGNTPGNLNNLTEVYDSEITWLIKSQLCHFPATWPWASYLTFLSTSFLVCKMSINCAYLIGLRELD